MPKPKIYTLNLTKADLLTILECLEIEQEAAMDKNLGDKEEARHISKLMDKLAKQQPTVQLR